VNSRSRRPEATASSASHSRACWRSHGMPRSCRVDSASLRRRGCTSSSKLDSVQQRGPQHVEAMLLASSFHRAGPCPAPHHHSPAARSHRRRSFSSFTSRRREECRRNVRLPAVASAKEGGLSEARQPGSPRRRERGRRIQRPRRRSWHRKGVRPVRRVSHVRLLRPSPPTK
jgi:hypothetical protein